MLKVNPATGEHYKEDTNYYSIYKLGDRYFYVYEILENPYEGQWDEFIGAYEEEWNAIQMLNILNGVMSRNNRMKTMFKWNTNLKRDLEENNK